MPQSKLTIPEITDRKKRNPLSPLVMQCIVCAMLVLSVFALYRSGTPTFTALRDRYQSVMQTDYCEDGVWTAAQKLAQNAAQATEEAVQTIASIDERAPIETVSSSGGEDIQILDALQDANFHPVTVSESAVMPVDGKVTSEFGFRTHPITGERSCHTGLDLAAPMGTPVLAAYSGTVTETNETSGRGKYIRLQHGTSMQTLYCHLSEIDVSEGDEVEAGDVIGLVGSTGMSTGPHLHFEVWIDGVRCNPVYILHELIYA